MDKCDLLRGNHLGNQLGTNILIDGKGLRNAAMGIKCRGFGFHRSLGCGNITEHQLGQLVCLATLPHLQNVSHAKIDLAFRIVRESRIDDPLVKPQLPSVAGYFQHVVNIRGNGTAVDQCRSLRKLLNKFLLNLAGFGCNVVIFHLRHRKVQMISSLNVRNLPENVHQLRQIKEAAEPCPGAVTLSLRCQFQGSNGFSEPGGPTVEVNHAHFLQTVIL